MVGHSSGAHLGVSILCRSDPSGQGAQGRPGAVIPVHWGRWCRWCPSCQRPTGCAPICTICRTRDELTWVDVTAPGDGCAFALCDPVAVSGVAPAGQTLAAGDLCRLYPNPERLSAGKTLRWRFFRLHFQYLCAFDRPGDYDYFQITAGPVTLGRPLRRSRPVPQPDRTRQPRNTRACRA